MPSLFSKLKDLRTHCSSVKNTILKSCSQSHTPAISTNVSCWPSLKSYPLICQRLNLVFGNSASNMSYSPGSTLYYHIFPNCTLPCSLACVLSFFYLSPLCAQVYVCTHTNTCFFSQSSLLWHFLEGEREWVCVCVFMASMGFDCTFVRRKMVCSSLQPTT